MRRQYGPVSDRLQETSYRPCDQTHTSSRHLQCPDLHRFRDKAAFGEPVGSEPAPFDFIQDIWISLSRVLTCALFADPKFNHFDTILACD